MTELKLAIKQKNLEFDLALEQKLPHSELYRLYQELKALHQQYELLQHPKETTPS